MSTLLERVMAFLENKSCSHRNVGWPRTDEQGKPYITCHDCKQHLPYNNPILLGEQVA